MTEASGAAPRVSVVMAAYNGMPHLRAAVDSILAQTYHDFEFIIVDDASSDGTRDYLATLSDPRLRLIRNDENRGLTRSLNAGLRTARGDYIARMDDDDIALAGRLAAQVAALDAHPDVVVLGAHHAEFYEDESPPAPTSDAAGLEVLDWDQLMLRNTLCHSSVMFRRAEAASAGLYREAFERSQDYDLWLRLAQTGTVARLNQVLCLFRRRADSVSLTQTYRQRRYAALAQHLAGQRRETGADDLERNGAMPGLPPLEEIVVRRATARILLEFSLKLLRAGRPGESCRLLARAILFSPWHAFRAGVSMLAGGGGD